MDIFLNYESSTCPHLFEERRDKIEKFKPGMLFYSTEIGYGLYDRE